MHDDWLMIAAPDWLRISISRGVTTTIASNCGISLAPAPVGLRAPIPVPLALLDDEGDWFR